MARPKNEREALRYEVEKYQSHVLGGKRPAGRFEKLAIERQLRDLNDGAKRGLRFSWDHALHACKWPPLLIHPKGGAGGKPFTLVPTQKAYFSYLFGWRKRDKDHPDGEQYRFTHTFYSVGRGGGKSPIAAATLSKKMCNDLPLAVATENICAATTRSQATEYVWEQVKLQLASQPFLNKRSRLLREKIIFNIMRGGKTLPSTLKALGADGGNADGGGYHCAVIDELHAFKNTVGHRELVEKIKMGMGKRPNCLLMMTTTAGNDQSKIWRDEYDFAEKVLTQVVVEDSFLPWIMCCDPDDNPFDERNWIKANPLLGITVSYDTLRKDAERARHSPAALTSFRRYRLNMLVSSMVKAIDPEKWRRGNSPLINLDGLDCHGGLDLGWSNDLAAWVLVFPKTDSHGLTTYYVKAVAWLPSDCPHDLTSEPWASFRDNGSLIVTDSETTDHPAIREQIVADSKRFRIQSIAADKFGARMMLDELTNDHGLNTFGFTQNAKYYHEPFRLLTETVAQSRLIHAGDPLLAWCADNVVLSTNTQGQMMPTKQRSLGKIDPFVALLMAYSECLYSQAQRSVYETDGLRTV